jgi:aminopeptidase N
MFKKLFGIIFVLALFAASVLGQRTVDARPTESGGVLSDAQAAYDVKHYDLAVSVDVANQSIKGVLTVKAQIVKPIKILVLDLDTPFTVEKVNLMNSRKQFALKFVRTETQVLVHFPTMQNAGKTVEVRVAYAGKPRVAPNPPWVGGFVWDKTKDGQPWIATAVQMDGADLWFPVKDHPSDKADTFAMHFTVPDPLVAASNGKLQSVTDNKDGTKTYNWFVSQPISNYCISLNAAPYKVIKDSTKSITGETIPIEFYVLPEDFAKGQTLVDLVKKYNAFFEEYLGPYPFRSDKIGIAETPHLGMEHQSITAYGNEFKYNSTGDDWLLFHEFGHEWWANHVTAPDWNDMWIHEGFQSFMDTFYIEKTRNKEAYFKAMANRYKGLKNLKAVAPREPRTTTEMYFFPPDYIKSDGDMYAKGALILHALRYYIGDDAFFRSLRKMSYATPAMEKNSAKQFHFGTTDDFMRIAEKESGKKLDWFFEIYLRQPALPKLVAEASDVEEGAKLVKLNWETPNNMPFPMTVEVRIEDTVKRVDMPNGRGQFLVKAGQEYSIDPNGWILKTVN